MPRESASETTHLGKTRERERERGKRELLTFSLLLFFEEFCLVLERQRRAETRKRGEKKAAQGSSERKPRKSKEEEEGKKKLSSPPYSHTLAPPLFSSRHPLSLFLPATPAMQSALSTSVSTR